MSAESVMQCMPTTQQLIDAILDDPEDRFRDVSMIIDTDLLQKAAYIIDNKQIKKIVTIPGNVEFYEFNKPGRNEVIRYCRPDYCECGRYISNIANNRSVLLCEHMLAIAIVRQSKISIPIKKVNLSDILSSL